MDGQERYDVLVIGGGPSGQKAAIQAAKAGRRVLLVERESGVGGECVRRGTIPSKTLRESAVYLQGLKARTAGILDLDLAAGTRVASLMHRLRSVLDAHHEFLGNQLCRNQIEYCQGRARFVSPRQVRVQQIDRRVRHVEADTIVIAVGSRPRSPKEVPVDHEHILDSDSILSLIYLPESLTVLGGGVIACEFASIFASLGVKVTLVDKHERPLGFLDPELTAEFLRAFERVGGRFIGQRSIRQAGFNGLDRVVAELESGEQILSEKLFCALGRVANADALDLDRAGLALDQRGLIPVDQHCRTSVAHIYAEGDVIGPPALATSSMEQGRRAVRHALGLSLDDSKDQVPVGIYTIPELASVGLSEAQAVAKFGTALVGRASFREVARGHINGHTEGLLKLVCEPESRRVVGAQIAGEGATELIHLAQMALIAGLGAEVFVESIFNFPTLAEAYRVAALDLLGRLETAHLRAA